MERKISAAAFKARCLALIDEVANSGQPITVTKRGKAKVQIVAVRETPSVHEMPSVHEKPSVRGKPRTLLGATKGTFRILGDIVGPIVDEWEDPATDRARAKPRKGVKEKMHRQDARR